MTYHDKRVKSGIPGLDQLLDGGIPERSLVLLSGGPGTGKTIFAQQFIWEGLSNNEGGVYVALGEHPIQVRTNMEIFGWNAKDYEKKGKLAIIDAFSAGLSRTNEKYIIQDIGDINEVTDVLRIAIKNTSAKRVVIDPVTTLYINEPISARSVILQLKRVIVGLGCTAIFISETSPGEKGFGDPGVEQGADGIIRLDLDEKDGELIRSLVIWKMRGTSHSLKRHKFEITQNGITISQT